MVDPFITNHVEYVRSGGVTLGADEITVLAPGLGIGAWPDATDEAGTLGTGRAPAGTVHGSRSWLSYVIENILFSSLEFSFYSLSFSFCFFPRPFLQCPFPFLSACCLSPCPTAYLSLSLLSLPLLLFLPPCPLTPSSSLFPFSYFIFPFPLLSPSFSLRTPLPLIFSPHSLQQVKSERK